VNLQCVTNCGSQMSQLDDLCIPNCGITGCLSCDNRTNMCLTCSHSSFILSDGLCLCPQMHGTLNIFNITSQACSRCPRGFVFDLASPGQNKCRCPDGYTDSSLDLRTGHHGHAGKCIKNCPYGWFAEGDNCSKCSPQC